MTPRGYALAAGRRSGNSRGRCPLLFGCLSLLLVGCATPREQGAQSTDRGEIMQADTEFAPSIAGAPSTVLAASDRDVSPSGKTKPEAPSPAEEPVAVIELHPMADALPPEMEARLREVAEAAKADERLSLWLEGFVPDGGSPALNMGLAERSLAVVRQRLIAMRVPANRIQIIPFGEHHNRARSPINHWVEIFYRIHDR